MRWLVGKNPAPWLFIAVAASVCLSPVSPTPARDAQDYSLAAAADSVRAASKAEVSIASDQQMDFGQLADHDGSVSLGLSDNIVSDPDFISYGGSPYSGIVTITGDPSTAVDISVTTAPVAGLSLSSFSSNEGGLPLIGVLLDESGQLVLTIGATITVNSATASIGAGQSVSYTITSTYN